MKVADIREYFISELAAGRFVQDKTGVKTIEMIGASFEADEPTIFGKVSKEYVERELAWYQSKSLSVHDIPGKIPEIWKQVSDDNGYINSNYGYLVWHENNYNQFDKVVQELRQNPNSRRAVMIYNRPSMHYDYKKNGMSDFICTNGVQYLIRDNVLHVVVSMRSNDLVYGYRNDFAWQDHLAELVQDKLKCISRKIIWQVGSLHVYERHFKLVV
jgi:thymidylate synthase